MRFIIFFSFHFFVWDKRGIFSELYLLAALGKSRCKQSQQATGSGGLAAHLRRLLRPNAESSVGRH